MVVCTHLIIMRYGIDILLSAGPLYENVLVSVTIFAIVMLLEYMFVKIQAWLMKTERISDKRRVVL